MTLVHSMAMMELEAAAVKPVSAGGPGSGRREGFGSAHSREVNSLMKLADAARAGKGEGSLASDAKDHERIAKHLSNKNYSKARDLMQRMDTAPADEAYEQLGSGVRKKMGYEEDEDF